MPYLNSVQLMGHIGKDPESRTISNGSVVTNFTLATTYARKVENDWKEETTWHRIVAWNLSEYALKNMTRGALVFLTGRISNREYKKTDGSTGYTSEVIAEKLQPIVQKQNQDRPVQRETVEKIKQRENYDRPDDEIPF
jgi:single-strand DNA-binding protein